MASTNNVVNLNTYTSKRVVVTNATAPAVSTSQVFYPIFSNSTTTGSQDLRNTDRLYIYEDTSSTYLCVGSSSSSGGLILKNSNSIYTDITTAATTSNKTLKIPDSSGWIAVGGDGSSTGAGGEYAPVYLSTNGVLTEITGGTTGQFYRGDKGWSNTLDGAFTASGSINGGVYTANTAQSTEYQIKCNGGAGTIYMYSQAATTGNRGLYGVNSAGTGVSIITVDSSNAVSLNGNAATATTADEVVHTATGISYISGAKGIHAAVFAKKATGSVWYPAVALQTSGGGAWQIGNYNDETLEFQYATKANIDSTTNTTSEIYMRAGDTGYVLTSGNYSSHTHSYLPLSGGTMTGTILGSNTNLGSTTYGQHFAQLYLGRATSDSKALDSANPLIEFSNNGRSQYAQIVYTDYNNQGGSDSFTFVSNQSDLRVYAPKVHGAVWNDYAECRNTEDNEPGYCLMETESGIMKKCNKRMTPGCRIISDTYGMLIGETNKAKSPIAVSGRVLVYTKQDRNSYPLGMPVCAADDGTVDLMTREEIINHPECIVGTVSEIPTYDIWYAGQYDEDTQRGRLEIPVNNRIWIYVR